MTTRSAVSRLAASSQPAVSSRPAISSESLRFIWQPSVQTWNRGSVRASGRYSARRVVGGACRAARRVRWRGRDELEHRQRAGRGRSFGHGCAGEPTRRPAPGMPAATSGGTHSAGVRLGVRPGVAVVVAAAGRDETERPRDLADRLDRRHVERAVVDLEPAEAGVGQLADDVDPGRRLAEMGQRREPAGGPDRLDRLDRAETAARHVGRLPPAEQSPEGVLDARRVAGRDQRAGDGRPAERVVVGRIGDVRELVRRSTGRARAAARRSARTARGAGRAGRRGSPRTPRPRVHPEAEDVELALPQPEVAGDDGVDLDARDEGHAGRDGARRRRPRDSRRACRGRSGPGAGPRRPPRPGRARRAPRRRRSGSCGCGGRSSRGRGLDAAGAGRCQRIVAAATRPGRHVTPR